jgi:hypothetical protein
VGVLAPPQQVQNNSLSYPLLSFLRKEEKKRTNKAMKDIKSYEKEMK